MRYELPLFFVCVRTNVGYCVVADFIVQSECAVSIKEALLVLRSWNLEWNPPFFMSDFSEAEISALEQTFPGVTVYGCDFHREQVWTRWIQDHKNGLSVDEREQLLSLLRDCAWAPSASELACDFHYKQSLEKLQKSTVWKQHENVRNWLVGSWLNSPKRWARAFRDHNFYAAVDTNNGTEAMNKLFKYKFMPRRKSFTLSALVTQLSDRFLPDLHRNYVLQNLKGSPMYREYNDVVPNYLHGKPRSVVLHCLERKARSNRYDDEDIVLSDEDGIFKIKKLDTFKHTVNFLQPSCTCKDWIRWHLPCKHMFAVISLRAEWGWNALPKSYRESPYLQADNDAIMHYYGDSGDSGEQQVQMVEETDATLISISDNQCSTPANIQKSQGGIKRLLKTESVKARQMLKQLEILTYSMDNIDVLVNFNQCLKKLYEETQSKMPKKEGLLCRRRGDTSVIISRRKIKRARTTLQCSTLPRCKRAKQSKVKQRVGLKAEKKKVARLAKQKAAQPAIVQEEEMAQEGLNRQEAIQMGQELQEPSIVTAGTKIGGKGKHICGQCTGCLATDCGKCVNCVDKKKFGGPGKRKQRCKERQCQGL
ncbi:uncharacterized protein [Dysidea avara]|uniref:uncharacterized protein n=1 Tax=Dysidea avara TaxID=196820 RepID=UPI00331699DD